MGLTPKQQRILEFLEQFAAEHGYAPSQAEIARHFGFRSLGTVQNYLVRLEREGLLKKAWNARRGTQVLSTSQPPTPLSAVHPSSTVPLPLLGRVAAGKPIEVISSGASDAVDIPLSFLKGSPHTHFVLQVSGNSMKDDGILNGDWVVIKKADRAQNGQTVVALVQNEATIKRFYQRAGKVELHPANPDFQPIVLTPEEEADFKIEGICTGVLRRLS
jgi:repressor LexA